MAAPQKVHVPQQDGEIVLTAGGDTSNARTHPVVDHLVSPRNRDEQEQLLLLVAGARLATKKDLASAGSAPSAGTPGPSQE